MRKGFTLVELLAVIVILAIILVISVPKILNVIENARKSTFENNSKLILKSLKLISESNNMKGIYSDTFILYENGVKTTYPSSNNSNFSFEATDGGIIVYGDGSTMMAVYDGTNCAIKSKTSDIVTVSNLSKENCITNIYYKQGNAPFSNLISNGYFGSNTTGWVNSGGINSIVDGKLYHVSSGTYAYSQTYSNFPFNANRKYYVSFDYSNDASVTTLYFRWIQNNGSSAEGLAALPLSQTTKKYSGIHLITSAGSYSQIGFNILQYAPTGKGYYIDNVCVIDLTSTYGVGNEPIVDQMNENINKVWIDTANSNTPKRYVDGSWLAF